jgi:hypothetical protein
MSSSEAVHEFRNHLAVAIANVDAIRDGVLAATPERCEVILQALTEAEVLLTHLFPAPPDGSIEHR